MIKTASVISTSICDKAC